MPNFDDKDGADKVALIVGAGQGIGLGFVRQLLARKEIGYLFATYRSVESATELLAITDRRLHCLQLDITDESQIAAAIDRIKSQTAKLHYTINCVGVLHDGEMQPEKSLRQIDSARLLRYFQVNSIGAMLLFKQIQPLLKHEDRSIVATISAKVGSIGDNQLGGWYGYRASKAALNMFIKTTSIEYQRTCPKVIIVALHPGTTDTKLSLPFQRNVPPEKLFSVDRTVTQLLTVIDELADRDSGEFFNWDGNRLPW
jgi:NAD(P)-dependent dehydrogenase (short-subunit alcohol dehydrogenase family)